MMRLQKKPISLCAVDTCTRPSQTVITSQIEVAETAVAFEAGLCKVHFMQLIPKMCHFSIICEFK